MSDSLENIICNLIDNKHEGAYWDYKSDYCDNNAEFLRDIVCMANNLENKDAYLIYGVDDNGNILGMETKPCRKNQNVINNFLKEKKFAGGIRPVVQFCTINKDNHELDVLVIKNTKNTPYFILEDVRDRGRIFKANNIYTRVMDANTDIDKTADIDKIEYLWKKRFGIELSSIEMVAHLLENPKDWYPMGTDGVHSSDKFHNTYYNKNNPEYTITYNLKEDRFKSGTIDKIEIEYFWLNTLLTPLHNTDYFDIEIKCHSTIMFSTPAIFADGYRFCRTQWPIKTLFENDSREVIRYCYIIRNGILYGLDNWLTNKKDTIDMINSIDRIESIHPEEFQLEYVT